MTKDLTDALCEMRFACSAVWMVRSRPYLNPNMFEPSLYHGILKKFVPFYSSNLSKSGFVSEEGHSGCKFENIAIRALKRNVLFQIWFKWTY